MNKINIDDLEKNLKIRGVFYRNKTNAFCFKLKKDTGSFIFWQKGETYREFLERCKNYINTSIEL